MYGLGHQVETLQSKVVDEARIGASWSCKEVERTSGCAVSSRWALAKTWQSRHDGMPDGRTPPILTRDKVSAGMYAVPLMWQMSLMNCAT